MDIGRHILTGIFTLVLLMAPLLSTAQIKLIGKVVDKRLGEPLVFVAVGIEGSKKGTITNIDGTFELEVPSRDVLINFRYVGYQPLSLSYAQLAVLQQVELEQETKVLNEVTVLAGENPAHPIIRKLVENKPRLNPSAMDSYSFESYNKFSLGTDISPEIDREDSVQVDMKKYLSENFLFSMESVTKRHYKSFNKVKEEVLANRVSGFKSPQFTTMASSFQNIGFYDDFITVMSINFLNPISKNSFDNYYFDLVDSVNDEVGRKSYVIAFEPKKKNFNGLKGIMNVDASDFALSSIDAETTGFTDLHNQLLEGQSQFDPNHSTYYDLETYLTVNFKLQQHYTKIRDEVWFPDQLKFDVFFGEFVKKDSPSFPLMGIGKSYLKNIAIDPDVSQVKFDRTVLTYHDLANDRDSIFWNQYREPKLTPKEIETYEAIDSVFEANKVEKIMTLTAGLIEKKIAIGLFDINLHRAFDINKYEGFRLGMGLSTSEKISKTFELGGYWSYGIKDKEDKFGGYFDLHLLNKKRLDFFINYSDDVEQFGKIQFYKYKPLPLETETYYPFLIDNMFNVVQKEAGFRFYWLRYMDTELSLRQREISVNNDYSFIVNEADLTSTNEFDFTEVSLKLGYNYGVNYVEAFNKLLRTTRSNLYLGLNYTQGLSDFGGQFEYRKIEGMVQRKFLTRGFGQPTFTLQAGYIDEVLPITNSFNIHGTSNEYLDVANSFRTMGINEFVTSKYVNLFYQHYVSQFVIHPKYSKPQLVLQGALAYGEGQNSERHTSSSFSELDDYYFEAGILVRRLVRALGYSFGVGLYQRMGNYAFEKQSDNMFFKINITFDSGE
jgi:hypothetical protein